MQMTGKTNLKSISWTKNLPKNVGTCLGNHLQLIARNLVFKTFWGEKLF